MAVFPSGNLIIALEDYPIKIYDTNYNEIQNIEGDKEKLPSQYRNYGHIKIDIKDENNFCSFETVFIKTWIKKNNIFIFQSIYFTPFIICCYFFYYFFFRYRNQKQKQI